MPKISLEDELSLPESPDVMNWSENFCFVGFDPHTRIGFYLHLGRWPLDRTGWREQVLLFLPDGSFLIQRSYGFANPIENAICGPGLKIFIEEASDVLRLKYKGPTRRTWAAELAAPPLPEALPEMIEFDLRFESTGGIWDFASSHHSSAIQTESWATFHYEQPGHFRGNVTFSDGTMTLDAAGYRDHSRGPRDVSGLVGHCWIQGHFDHGRSFALCYTRNRSGGTVLPGMSASVIFDEGRVYPATTALAPFLVSPFESPSSQYSLTIASELGTMQVEAEVVSTLPFTVGKGFDNFNGIVPSLGVNGLFAQTTLFRWNGQHGAGFTERSSSMTSPR